MRYNPTTFTVSNNNKNNPREDQHHSKLHDYTSIQRHDYTRIQRKKKEYQNGETATATATTAKGNVDRRSCSDGDDRRYREYDYC